MKVSRRRIVREAKKIRAKKRWLRAVKAMVDPMVDHMMGMPVRRWWSLGVVEK